mmetsp:Transcript_73120/g.207195  ORF Transcript_73120/g.207195 Transcript_73120/m.207195 type:complete len:252 (-) Transcript_73120:890-1645(-)
MRRVRRPRQYQRRPSALWSAATPACATAGYAGMMTLGRRSRQPWVAQQALSWSHEILSPEAPAVTAAGGSAGKDLGRRPPPCPRRLSAPWPWLARQVLSWNYGMLSRGAHAATAAGEARCRRPPRPCPSPARRLSADSRPMLAAAWPVLAAQRRSALQSGGAARRQSSSQRWPLCWLPGADLLASVAPVGAAPSHPRTSAWPPASQFPRGSRGESPPALRAAGPLAPRLLFRNSSSLVWECASQRDGARAP